MNDPERCWNQARTFSSFLLQLVKHAVSLEWFCLLIPSERIHFPVPQEIKVYIQAALGARVQSEQTRFFSVISITLLPFLYFRISLRPEKMGKNTNPCPNTSSFTPQVRIPALWFSDTCLFFAWIKSDSFALGFCTTTTVWDTLIFFQREDTAVFVRTTVSLTEQPTANSLGQR